MDRDLQIFRDSRLLADHLGNELMDWVAGSSGERYHIAVSGGNTPDLLFSALAANYAESRLWQKCHFWWVDERMVAPEDPESNFGRCRELLLSKIVIPAENVHRIRGEKEPYQEAEVYETALRSTIPAQNGWPIFDFMLLGMGEDGHTASIFPNQLELLKSGRLCAVATHPVTQQKRVTLTGNVINHAARICFQVTGANKAKPLSEIWSAGLKGKLLPAGNIRAVNGQILWFADEQAASLIP
jgi:6-phosphogluconolactonase